MTTLFDLTYRVARELGILSEGTATGGSTSSIVDTNDRTEANDYWNLGSAWITYDGAGAGAAPQGQYKEISDFVLATGTITLRSTLTAAVASTDRYAISDRRFPLHVLIQMVNQAITDLGRIPVTDKTSLTTASDKTEYTLPTAVLPDSLRQVFLQLDNSDSDNNQWVELYNWSVEVTATSTADILILPLEPESGYKLKIVYVAVHPELVSYNSVLSETVPIERVIYNAAYLVLKWWRDKYKQDYYNDSLQRMMQKAEQARQQYPIRAPRKASKLVLANTPHLENDSEPNKVYL
jgi:hypothetical protein